MWHEQSGRRYESQVICFLSPYPPFSCHRTTAAQTDQIGYTSDPYSVMSIDSNIDPADSLIHKLSVHTIRLILAIRTHPRSSSSDYGPGKRHLLVYVSSLQCPVPCSAVWRGAGVISFSPETCVAPVIDGLHRTIISDSHTRNNVFDASLHKLTKSARSLPFVTM